MIAPLCCALKFRKFAPALLLLVCLANAAINVSVSDNVEIAGFIESESVKIMQVPDGATLTLNYKNEKDKHSRAGYLFFLGEREVSIEADYTLVLPNSETLKGTVKADTSWLTGYCGMIECQTKPMPAQQRIEVTKTLVSKLLKELNGKFHGLFVGQTASAPNSVTDSVLTTDSVQDSVPAQAPAADSVQSASPE